MLRATSRRGGASWAWCVLLAASSGCLEPRVSDDLPTPGLLLPAGSVVPGVASDAALAAQIDDNDAVDRRVPLNSAFVGGGQVFFWDFGPAPDNSAPLIFLRQPTDDGSIDLLPHPPILDVIPGDPNYTPFWAIWHVDVTELYNGEIIPSLQALQEAQELGLVEMPEQRPAYLNCPVVHPDVRIEVGAGNEDAAPSQAFYRGLQVDLVNFAFRPLLEDKTHVPVAELYVLRREGGDPLSEVTRGVDMTGDGDTNDSNDVFQYARDDDPYTPLSRVVSVTVPAGYMSIDSYASEATADATDDEDLFDTASDPPAPRSGAVIAVERTEELRNLPVQEAPGEL
ncbi:MAG TPA: hypothetical protein VK698_04700 [Kofleriaceae bacterium]|nr:hypothetical protein [Kofleriaceae bacterium]